MVFVTLLGLLGQCPCYFWCRKAAHCTCRVRWWVTWNKQRRSKFFSDSVYGDRLAALGAALEWRNQAEQELGKPRTERQVIGVSRTSTGIVGVRRTVKDGREVYEATWRDGNRIRRTSYSIAKHGERRALSLARRAREKFERQRQRTPVGD